MRRVVFAIFMVLGCHLFSDDLVSGISISDEADYRRVAYVAAINDLQFKLFKQNPGYTKVLEHATQEEGRQYLEVIRDRYPHLLGFWPQFAQNDAYGSPKTYYYPGLGYASPTTLRYIKTVGDLLEITPLEGQKILEIGAGYGGQCKIISDVCAFAEYAIIDLAEPLALINKYLKVQGVDRFRLIRHTATSPEDFDFIISNYAFSECNREVQDGYLQNYILRSKAGYMIWNDMRRHLLPTPYSLDELCAILREHGYVVEVKPEHPCTKSHNVQLTWSLE